MNRIGPLAGVAACSILIGTAQASQVPFDASWSEQGFLRLWTNDYSFRGTQLDVVSDGTVSLVGGGGSPKALRQRTSHARAGMIAISRCISCL